MKVAILGAGKQARGALHYLFDKNIEKITVVDKDGLLADDLIDDYAPLIDDVAPQLHLTSESLDAADLSKLTEFLKEYEVAFNSLPYFLALNATKAAIAAKCDMVDLGGNSEVVDQQFALSGDARKAGVTIIPDCGLAPGLVSLLTADAFENSDISQMESVRIYVGGLPLNKTEAGPLEYGEFFSLEGLLNEYREPVRAIRNGEIITIDPLTEREEISFTGGNVSWVTLEAFTTSGGASTLPETFQGRVSNLEYKTLRFPGHLRSLQLLKTLGILNVKTLWELCRPNIKDQIFLKIDAKGSSKDGHRIERTYTLHVAQERSNLSAMMMCTAYPAAIIMLMLGRNKDWGPRRRPPGVYRQEQIINSKHVMQKLAEAHLKIDIQERIIYDPR